MPEGDTLARIAVALRPYLAGRVVTAARGERACGAVILHGLLGLRDRCGGLERDPYDHIAN